MPITLSSTTPLSLIDSCTKMPGLRCYFLAKAKVIIATAVSVHRNLSTGESKEQRYISDHTTSSLTFIRCKFLAVQIKACSVCPPIQRPHRALHKSLPDRRVRTMRRKAIRPCSVFYNQQWKWAILLPSWAENMVRYRGGTRHDKNCKAANTVTRKMTGNRE